MFKTIILFCLICCFGVSFGFQNYDKKHSGSVHHAAIHAEHWVHNHSNPPHQMDKKKYPRRHKPDKSVHHRAIHAEHWLNHHLSAPHKNGGG